MSWLLYRVGMMIRETGQALERVGVTLQGSRSFTGMCSVQSKHGLPFSMLHCKMYVGQAWPDLLLLLAAEPFYRHRPVMNLETKLPTLGKGTFVAPSASVVGEVSLGDKASVWYGSVLRGEQLQQASTALPFLHAAAAELLLVLMKRQEGWSSCESADPYWAD